MDILFVILAVAILFGHGIFDKHLARQGRYNRSFDSVASDITLYFHCKAVRDSVVGILIVLCISVAIIFGIK